MTAPADRLPKQDTRFKPGQSGNPAGRKPGTRNHVSLLAERLMEDEAQAVIQAVIDAAKAGDTRAAQMVLDRLAPLPKSRPVNFTVPPILTAEDVASAMQSVLAATADGTLTPDEGQTVASIIEVRRKALETAELEARIQALEAAKESER